MSALRSSTGLASGLDIQSLASALVARQQAVITRVRRQGARFEAEQAALSAVEASVLRLQFSARSLSDTDTFREFAVSGVPESIRIEPGEDAVPGSYTVQAVRVASAQNSLSRGFTSAEADLGGGTVTVRTGGEVQRPVSLDLLNGGSGVERGTIRVTDRSGQSADVDLSTALDAADVIDAVNAAGIGVEARTSGDRFILTDTSGGGGSLSVADVTGSAAADLGIAASVAGSTLTGDDVLTLTDGFGFELLGDGLGPKLFKGAPDIRVTAADGSTFDVSLDDAATVGGVVDAINSATGGAVTASLADDRIVLTDTTAGAGSTGVEDINGSFAVSELGLDQTASGGVLTGRRLLSGLNSTLLRNANGGNGIQTPGAIALTNRAGLSTVVDVSGAETLDDIIAAIGTAEASGTSLGLTASVDETGTGLVIRDTSGGAGNLTIGDASGTTAADLGIVFDGAADETRSGSLDRRFVGNSFALSEYARDGQAFSPGTIQITDSAGDTATVNLSAAVKTVGDAISRINAAGGIAVRAELNETGDGFTIIDEAGGGGSLAVADVDSTTAADLRLDAPVTTTAGGEQQISSRYAAVVELSAGESLTDLRERLIAEADFLTADVLNDGSAVNPARLTINSRVAGSAGRLYIESTGIDLGVANTSEAQDAVARFGPGNGFLLRSTTNTFEDVPGGFELRITEPTEASVVTVSEDSSSIKDAVEGFVDNFNSVVSSIAEQTRYDSETGERGVLQGDSFVLRLGNRLGSLVTSTVGESDVVSSLASLGVRFGDNGRLEFDQARFDRVASESPAELEKFFAGDEGFGGQLDELVETLTDSAEGDFTARRDALNDRIGGVQDRVQSLTTLMASRRERLFTEFVRMEQILASLQAQQQTVAALGGLGPIR